ncbi:MAG TPA: acyltransferase [Thermoleophilaceae bacterium]
MDRVEPVVAPPPGNPRFPLFDGLRAIAVLAVLVTHTALLSGANELAWYGKYTARLDVGVTIFFLISGFLLYRPFVAAHLDGRSGPRLRDYARRRVLRIVPAYWLALTALSIYPGLVAMWSSQSWVYYLFLQDYRGIWTFGGLQPAWSLSIEVAFYAALPLVAYGLRRAGAGMNRAGRVRLEAGVIVALGAASVVVRLLTPESPRSQWHITLPGTFYWFALGMLLAVASAALAGREPGVVRFLRRWPSAAWLVALALFWFTATQVGLGGTLYFRITTTQSVAMHLLYGAIAFFVLLPAVFAGDGGGVPRRILRNRFVAWLGLISYGVFLWHHPIAVKLSEANDHGLFPSFRMLGMTAATLALAVACAAISYYVLERPILRYKDGLARYRIQRVEDMRARKGGTPAGAVAGASAGDAQRDPG